LKIDNDDVLNHLILDAAAGKMFQWHWKKYK